MRGLGELVKKSALSGQAGTITVSYIPLRNIKLAKIFPTFDVGAGILSVKPRKGHTRRKAGPQSRGSKLPDRRAAEVQRIMRHGSPDFLSLLPWGINKGYTHLGQ